tara:strand:- start:61 stop:948 length:888 start_codon:yes stop_codon:yes gene_type:complete
MITKIVKLAFKKTKPTISGYSPKYKGVKTIPYKAPKKTSQLTRDDIKLRQLKAGDDNLRETIGGDAYGNFSHQSLESLRSQSIADKLAPKKFERTLTKELTKGRGLIAGKLRTNPKFKSISRPSLVPAKAAPAYRTKYAHKKFIVKSPSGTTQNYLSIKTKSGKYRVFKDVPAKSKIGTSFHLTQKKNASALKSLKIADAAELKVYSTTVKRFTDKHASSPMKTHTVASMKPRSFTEEISYRKTKNDWGFDPDDFSQNNDMMTGKSAIRGNTNFKKGQGPFSGLSKKWYDYKKKK